MNIIALIISPLLAIITGMFFLGISRKITARIHWRYGPPLLQPVIDVIRSFSQMSISHGKFFDFGIILSLTGSFVLVLFLPIGELCPSTSGGLIAFVYLMLISPFGIALSGGASANPNSSIGVSRKLLLSLAYEVPLLLVLLAVMTHYGTISFVDIVKIQASSGWAFGSWSLILPGIAYFLILPAILGVRPFEIVSAPQEISSGPIAEFGGKHLAFYTLHHALQLFTGLALFVDIFLGGGALFGLLNPIAGTVWATILGIIIFLLKMFIVLVVGLFINAVYPRFRIEQAIRYLWKWPTLIAFVGLVIVAIIN
jgi:NADH-quinone oxidoreductase subunit H